MSVLLVVTARPGGGLHGVLADAQRTEDGEQVFYRRSVEVARVAPGGTVTVRDVGLVRARVVAPDRVVFGHAGRTAS